MSKLAKADSTKAESSQIRPGTTTDPTPAIPTNFKFWLSFRFFY